jgi:hypothetical protein
LLDGLPSGFSPPNGDPVGPSGLAVHGETLYVTIGLGDAIVSGPAPNTQVANPNPSSPIFSSVLAMRLDRPYRNLDGGFSLTLADQFALKSGSHVRLRNAHGATLSVRLVADIPDYVPEPVPGVPTNVRQSNPFGIAVAKDHLYIPDASSNSLRVVNLHSGALSTITNFAPLPNTRGFGPPVVEAVPNSVRRIGDQLLVTVLSGFPFPIGAAQVRLVDPKTGKDSPFIAGLNAAIDVLPINESRHESSFLTLEFSMDLLGLPQPPPGRLSLFASRTAAPSVLADCLITPTSMTRDKRTGDIYVTEIFTGRVVRVAPLY